MSCICITTGITAASTCIDTSEYIYFTLSEHSKVVMAHKYKNSFTCRKHRKPMKPSKDVAE